MCSRFQGSMEAVLPAAIQLRQMVADWQSTPHPHPGPQQGRARQELPRPHLTSCSGKVSLPGGLHSQFQKQWSLRSGSYVLCPLSSIMLSLALSCHFTLFPPKV